MKILKIISIALLLTGTMLAQGMTKGYYEDNDTLCIDNQCFLKKDLKDKSQDEDYKAKMSTELCVNDFCITIPDLTILEDDNSLNIGHRGASCIYVNDTIIRPNYNNPECWPESKRQEQKWIQTKDGAWITANNDACDYSDGFFAKNAYGVMTFVSCDLYNKPKDDEINKLKAENEELRDMLHRSFKLNDETIKELNKATDLLNAENDILEMQNKELMKPCTITPFNPNLPNIILTPNAPFTYTISDVLKMSNIEIVAVKY